MKKLNSVMLFVFLVIFSLLALFGCKLDQPVTELSRNSQTTAVVTKVMWNLSGTVMPIPQYGSRDMYGSERASALTVYQTETQVQITGEMRGLRRNTSYTVFLANAYIPKTDYPGLFSNSIKPFTFKSDATGEYRWACIIFNADFDGSGTYNISLWIKESSSNETVLISDNFTVVIR